MGHQQTLVRIHLDIGCVCCALKIQISRGFFSLVNTKSNWKLTKSTMKRVDDFSIFQPTKSIRQPENQTISLQPFSLHRSRTNRYCSRLNMNWLCMSKFPRCSRTVLNGSRTWGGKQASNNNVGDCSTAQSSDNEPQNANYVCNCWNCHNSLVTLYIFIDKLVCLFPAKPHTLLRALPAATIPTVNVPIL